MHRWIVILEDSRSAESIQIRAERFEEHFTFLSANFRQIVFSCGLSNVSDQNESSYGGLWVVEADTEEEVRELFKQDPYFRLGLRQKIDMFRAHDGYI